ncbi:MAG: LysR family transcriptional regulator [bacterium]
MNLSKIDLNLLVYLDVLLREKNVTRAAQQLNITQPAMSNGLRRLRDLFGDPLLIRTSGGMQPTERGRELAPLVRQLISTAEQALLPTESFEPETSERTFRIMASDYIEATLIAPLLNHLYKLAPHITLDILNPSDVDFKDIENGKVDIAINRFDSLPQSFHQSTIWRDGFACLVSKHHQDVENFTLDAYLGGSHVWVSKTGMGAGTGMDSDRSQKVGRVDEALTQMGHSRNIRVFTRLYTAAALLAKQPDLIVTLPSRIAALWKDDPDTCILKPPFMIIPTEIQMAWSPLLHQNAGHKWLRRTINDVASTVQPA